jgi:hypothetical protein
MIYMNHSNSHKRTQKKFHCAWIAVKKWKGRGWKREGGDCLSFVWVEREGRGERWWNSLSFERDYFFSQLNHWLSYKLLG